MTTMDETATTPDSALPDSNRVALPDGGWVVLKDSKSIRQKDRKVVMAAMDKANANTESGVLLGATSIQDRIASLVIADWSYAHDEPPLQIPSINLDALDELEIASYDAISALCEPYMDQLFPDFSAGNADNESRVGPTGTSVA